MEIVSFRGSLHEMLKPIFCLIYMVHAECIFCLQEVEREISFRTETGLYYSYYKQMVLAPSVTQGKINMLLKAK